VLDACKLSPGATPDELVALETHLGLALPVSLKGFLADHNGQAKDAKLGLHLGRMFLSTEGIRAQWDNWRSIDEDAMNEDCAEFMSSQPEGTIKTMYTNPLWIPLTHDFGGNHVGLDFDPDVRGTRGQVIAFGRDEDQKQLLAGSFDEFLPRFVAELRGADWTFADKFRRG
jgi:cell wall assembly regulator SMI1